MFFSKLKKSKAPSKGLPENLVKLQDSLDTVWVWDPDYNMLVWANAKGMEFWKAKSRIELKELVFPQFHPMMQVSTEAMATVKDKGSFSKGLTLVTYPEEVTFTCHFTLQVLPDDREGLLVTIPAENTNAVAPSEENKSEEDQIDNLELLDLEDDSELASLEAEEDNISLDDLNETPQVQDAGEPVMSEPVVQAAAPQQNVPQILADESIFTTPFTISVHSNGFLLGADERTNFYIQASPTTRFADLFIQPSEADQIIQTALQSEQNSFVTRLKIQEQDLPFVVQTFSLEHEGQRILNVAMLRITDEQYHDHLTTIADAAQVNESHEQHEVMTEEEVSVAEEQPVVSSVPKPHLEEEAAPIVSDSTTTAMFDVSSEGIVLDVNNMSKSLTGLYKDDIVGRHIHALFDQNTAQNIVYFIQNSDSGTGEYVDGKECQFQGANNNVRDGILVIRPVVREKGGFLLLLTDNTDVKNMQKDIDLLKDESQKEVVTVTENVASVSAQKDNLVPDYLAHISHELRAPLNAISGYTELLKSEVFGAIDPKYKDYIASLDIAAHHAKEVVDELLDYAKLEAGGFVAEIAETDLSDVIKKALVLVNPQARFKNIEIHDTLLTGTPPIYADARLLKQVLCNILSNAVKYSDENENVYITAGLTKTKRLMIEVTNFGAGMTEEQIQTALSPYGRVQNSQGIKGTGLGLPLAKQLTELMSGHFLIHSVPNEKTRVRIIFEEDKVIIGQQEEQLLSV